MFKIENAKTPADNPAPNQFFVVTKDGKYFQSYNTVIAFIPLSGPVKLDPKWKCSRTTSKYRIQFLGEDTKETQKKVDSGEYIVESLN